MTDLYEDQEHARSLDNVIMEVLLMMDKLEGTFWYTCYMYIELQY